MNIVFDEKYAQEPVGFEPPVLSVFKAKTEQPCMICQRITHFIHVDFAGYLCSTDCIDQMWKEYEEACRLSDEKARA